MATGRASGYRWWSFAGGREHRYCWLKLGPVTVLWGKVFEPDRLIVEACFLNRLVWSSY